MFCICGSLNRLNTNIKDLYFNTDQIDAFCLLNKGEAFTGYFDDSSGIKWRCEKGFFKKYVLKEPKKKVELPSLPSGIILTEELGEMPTEPVKDAAGLLTYYAYQSVRVIIEVSKEYSTKIYNDWYRKMSAHKEEILSHFNLDYNFFSSQLKDNKSWSCGISYKEMKFNFGGGYTTISYKDDLHMENLPYENNIFPTKYTIMIGRIIYEEICSHVPEAIDCDVNYSEHSDWGVIDGSGINIVPVKKEEVELGKW